MTAAVSITLAAAVLTAGIVAAWPVIHPKPSPTPHRPNPTAPATPGPRHRAADAHTGSLSAADVLRALTIEAEQRDTRMRAGR